MGYPAVGWNGVTYLVVWSEALILGQRRRRPRRAGHERRCCSRSQRDPGLDRPRARRVFRRSRRSARASSCRGRTHGRSRIPTAGTSGAPRWPRMASCPASRQSRAQISRQFDAAVAWNGSLYLVAWIDYRSDSQGGNLYVGRVTASGQNLDGAGILLSAAADWHADPRITSDGTDFFVVWGHRNGSDGDVYAARVTGSGTVLDPEGFAVSAEPAVRGGTGCRVGRRQLPRRLDLVERLVGCPCSARDSGRGRRRRSRLRDLPATPRTRASQACRGTGELPRHLV